MRTEIERGSTVTVEHGIERPAIVATAPMSWGAIWAGFFVAIACELILTLLMVGVFAGALGGSGTPSGSGFGIGIAAWMFFETLISYYAGGWVAGRLTRTLDRVHAGLHAAAMWGITTGVLLYVLASLGGATAAAAVDVLRGAFGVGAPPVPGNVALAVATWVPIYFFFTLLVSLGCAVWGGRNATRA